MNLTQFLLWGRFLCFGATKNRTMAPPVRIIRIVQKIYMIAWNLHIQCLKLPKVCNEVMVDLAKMHQMNTKGDRSIAKVGNQGQQGFHPRPNSESKINFLASLT